MQNLKMINNKLTKSSEGFTIIELIISIFILAIAVVGIFSAFSVVTILTAGSADKLTGTYLAQEGMEIVRNIRDTNWLNMDNAGCAPGTTCTAYSWEDGLVNTVSNNPRDCLAQSCQADYTATFMSLGADYLKMDANGFYVYDQANSAVTKFKRAITIKPITGADGNSDYIMKVTVQVSWDERSTVFRPGHPASECIEGSNCITTEETLYNWYNYKHQ